MDNHRLRSRWTIGQQINHQLNAQARLRLEHDIRQQAARMGAPSHLHDHTVPSPSSLAP